MSIRKRTGSNGHAWQVRVYDDSGRLKSKTFKIKTDAQAWEHQYQLKKRTGDLDDLSAGRTLFSVFVARWESEYATVHLNPKTIQQNAGLLKNRLLPTFSSMQLRSITTSRVSEFQAQLVREEVGSETTRKTVTVLQGILRYAVEIGELKSNPVTALRKVAVRDKREARALSPSEVESLRAEMPVARDRTLVSVMALAGLRPGEAQALTWGDVLEDTIKVSKRALSDGTIANGTKAPRNATPKHRTVPLLAPLKKDLMEFRILSGVPDSHALIFPKADGTAWSDSDWRNWKNRVFRKATVRAGLHGVIPYDLRHSYGSLMHAARKNVIEIARAMGHSPQVNLGTYSHVIADLEGQTEVDATSAILAARNRYGQNMAKHSTRHALPTADASGQAKPSQGLEPWTPSLPWRCSTN